MNHQVIIQWNSFDGWPVRLLETALTGTKWQQEAPSCRDSDVCLLCGVIEGPLKHQTKVQILIFQALDYSEVKGTIVKQ